MNAPGSLAEQSHDQGVHRVSAREFHVVRLTIGRDTLKQELRHVGVFPFITFKRKLQEPHANKYNEYNDKTQEKQAFGIATQVIQNRLPGHRYVAPALYIFA